MKGFVAEYGMLMIVVMIVSLIAVYSFGAQSGGFKEQVAVIRPQPGLKAGTNLNQLRSILDKDNPTLEIQTEKLIAGKRYIWLQFVMNAVDADGQTLDVEVRGVIDPKGTVTTETETVVQKGSYMVTYRIIDQDGLTTEKQVCFVAD